MPNTDNPLHDGKVIILDCVGLYNRFGSPDEERNWVYFFRREKRPRGGDFPQPLGLEEVEGMKEVSGIRKTAAENAEEARKRAKLEVFQNSSGLFGIRNALDEIIANPNCAVLSKTAEGWFYGTDTNDHLVIFDKDGRLAFRKKHCKLELQSGGTFFIVANTPDKGRIKIGPFDKRLCISEKFLYTKHVIYQDDGRHQFYRTMFVSRINGVVMTDYELLPETMFFRKLVRDNERRPLLVGLDNLIYTFESRGLLRPQHFPPDETEKIIRYGHYWDL